MPDLTPPVEQPVTVSRSPVPEQTGTAVRDILLIVSAVPALIAVLGTRDVVKIVAYVSSVEFAPVLGVIVGAAVLGWRQLIARRNTAVKVTMAEQLPESKAQVR